MSNKNKRSQPDKDVSRNEDIGNRDKSDELNSSEDLPGYPHYPSEEDIMNPANRMEKLAADDENLTRSGAFLNTGKKEKSSKADLPDNDQYDGLGIVRGTEADVTKEDLLNLGPKSRDQDMGEDELKADARPDNVEDDELDIPGSELDDDNEEIGEEDEENNYYSLGGDRHENLEEDRE